MHAIIAGLLSRDARITAYLFVDEFTWLPSQLACWLLVQHLQLVEHEDDALKHADGISCICIWQQMTSAT
jgi:hypothetical protein